MQDRIIEIGTICLEVADDSYVGVRVRAKILPGHLLLILGMGFLAERGESEIYRVSLEWPVPEDSDSLPGVSLVTLEEESALEATPQKINGTPFTACYHPQANSLRVLFYREDDPAEIGQFEIFTCLDHRVQLNCVGINFTSGLLSL